MASTKKKDERSEVAKGSKPPHGGRWVYDPEKDEVTCVQKPTEYPEDNQPGKKE